MHSMFNHYITSFIISHVTDNTQSAKCTYKFAIHNMAILCHLLRLYILIILYLSLQAASKSLYSTAGIPSWTSSGCVRCLICRFVRELLLNSNNKLSSFAIFLNRVEIWVEKMATQILSWLKSSWVAFWVSRNGFYIEPTQIGELSRLNLWVAFIQSALSQSVVS